MSEISFGNKIFDKPLKSSETKKTSAYKLINDQFLMSNFENTNWAKDEVQSQKVDSKDEKPLNLLQNLLTCCACNKMVVDCDFESLYKLGTNASH